mmetsp:Transcript_64360/g.104108  ORF Transcript_64360/g.104108 Transcript_64360/m.104108 type:complete len:200 (+) Transcript_64360:935-1534(+)
MAAPGAHHLWVPLVLLGRVRQSISDAHALQLNLDIAICQLLVAREDAMRHRWDVVAGIALARDEELGVVVRHGLEKSLQELVHVLGDSVLIVVPSALGKACPWGLIHPHNVCLCGPRVGVQMGGLSIRADLARSIFEEHACHGRAARASSEPHHRRVIGRIAAALEEPEEVLLLLLPEGVVATVLLNAWVAQPGRTLDL